MANSILEQYKINYFTGDMDRIGATASELSQLKNLEDYEILIELQQNIGTNTTGTLLLPPTSTIERGAYPNGLAGIADEDCVVSSADMDGKGTDQPAIAANGAFIFCGTLSLGLDYTLTATPASDTVLYFVIRIKLKDHASLTGFDVVSARTIIDDGLDYVFMTTPPTATDDGYKRGTRWIDTTEHNEYLLTNTPTTADAKWKLTTNVDEDGNTIIEGGMSFGDAIIVPITGNIANLIIPDVEKQYLIHLEPNGNYAIDGIVAPNPPKTMKLEIFVTSAGQISFKNQSIAADPGNCFIMGGNKNVQFNEGISFIYDTIDECWRSASLNI